MTCFEKYEDTLIHSGYPNAVPLDYGIWEGEKAYRFDDEEQRVFVTLYRSKNGFRIGPVKKYYGRTGLGTRGFDIK